jgi:hypothetical protein
VDLVRGDGTVEARNCRIDVSRTHANRRTDNSPPRRRPNDGDCTVPAARSRSHFRDLDPGNAPATKDITYDQGVASRNHRRHEHSHEMDERECDHPSNREPSIPDIRQDDKDEGDSDCRRDHEKDDVPRARVEGWLRSELPIRLPCSPPFVLGSFHAPFSGA